MIPSTAALQIALSKVQNYDDKEVKSQIAANAEALKNIEKFDSSALES